MDDDDFRRGKLTNHKVYGEATAILAHISDEAKKQLATFAQNIGLAFQIKDDILDITSTTEELGKTVGSDTSSHKSTYPSLLGLTGAKNRLSAHHELAKESLVHLGNDDSILSLFADYIVDRNS
jgi:geranylgeranyl diphosphate synthase type II